MPKGKSAAPAVPEEVEPEEVETLDFEQALAALEQLVGELEGGDQPLEASLAAFERGVALTRRCQSALRAAEQKVEILSRNTVDGELQPFEPEQ
ncbi:exodeoxyribonuclease VII small subunit [Wenzhouxiangella sp. XN24]|uniref:exodeoxyribonuclease VII small subunit n=1 Tax=Wenzhouxiangella sp. XN24 TaxID=2713569 RepID=UPI0013EDE165|nr:exodeoxyribonuclease VII small subunit [Wenzhouxiangella sp. XN24]NGX16933.1 exodeoxyribonuclease VII small subunit [Wenzhouxiangella sp. XN24]